MRNLKKKKKKKTTTTKKQTKKQMNLFAKQKHTDRPRKQTFDYQRGKVGGS